MNKIFHILIIILFAVIGLLPAYAGDDDLDKEEEEIRLGHLFDHYMNESFVMLRDDRLQEKIEGVVERIASAAGKEDDTFRLRIINDRLPVVSSAPGYVYVSTGMLDILQNKDELAFAISHALAHAIGKDQYQAYIDAAWKDQLAKFTGHIMPLMVFSGLGGAALAGGGVTAATVSTFEGIVLTESGIFSSTVFIAQSATASDIRKKEIVHNILLPHIYLPETKTGLTVMIFLSDIYGGYGKSKEIKADALAIAYLHAAGYDPAATVSLLNKFRNDYIAKGQIFHLLMARPGLEKRIENANGIIENYK